MALEITKQKTHTIGKTLVKPCLLKTVKQCFGEASKGHIKRISLPAILFRGAFQNIGRCERPGDKWNESISNSNAFFEVDESRDVTSCAQLLVFVRYIHSGDIKRGAPVFCGTANYKCRCSRDVTIIFDSTELQWKYDCYPFVKCAGFHDKNYQLRCSFCYSCCFVAFAARFEIEQINSIVWLLFYYFCRRFNHLFKFVRHTAHCF